MAFLRRPYVGRPRTHALARGGGPVDPRAVEADRVLVNRRVFCLVSRRSSRVPTRTAAELHDGDVDALPG